MAVAADSLYYKTLSNCPAGTFGESGSSTCAEVSEKPMCYARCAALLCAYLLKSC